MMNMRGRIVIDPFKLLNSSECKKLGFLNYSLGSAPGGPA